MRSHAVEQNEATLQILRSVITAFDGVSAALFFVFSLGFTAGLVCYSAALLRGDAGDRRLGALLTIWSIFSAITLLETAFGTAAVSGYLGWVGPGFQPVARAYVGVWLLRMNGGSLSALRWPAPTHPPA